MKNKIRFLVCLLLTSTMILSGCLNTTSNLTKGIESNNIDRVPEQIDESLNYAMLNFTWNLFKESSNNEGNIMISPPSVYLALAMTLNGAKGETKEQMLKALSAEGITIEELNIGLNDWIILLMSDNRIAKLSIDNSIWYRDGFKANSNFLQTNADYYSAFVKSLDFSDNNAPEKINKWANDATNGTINKIVDEIDEATMMYLINAIYFKGDWKEQFSSSKTSKMEFSAPTGKVIIDFMNRRGNIDYIDSNGVTGVVLPYLDEQFAFVGLMPKEGQAPKEMIDDLTVLDFLKLLNSKETENIELSLPKFESSYEDSLVNELRILGMEAPFDYYNADFSLMKENLTKELYISEIKHKTFIKVDEKGTEASAVTSVEISLTSMPRELPKIVFDRPFIYGLVDVTTGIPLFMGIMENPIK